jgi:hypothetical protein
MWFLALNHKIQSRRRANEAKRSQSRERMSISTAVSRGSSGRQAYGELAGKFRWVSTS